LTRTNFVFIGTRGLRRKYRDFAIVQPLVDL